jgi:hypothetical protein
MALNYTTQLDATIDALGQNLTEARVDASANVRNWIDTLNGDDHAGMARLTDDLQRLESLLAAGQPDMQQLRQTLDSLGEQTTAASNQAQGATADKLRELGRQLRDVAEQMQ